MGEVAKLTAGDQTIELPIVVGTEDERALIGRWVDTLDRL